MNKNKNENKLEITIPQGYRSFKNELTIELNKGLNVITGINGSGKTQLLEYIYFEEIKETGKDSILLRTTVNVDAIKNRFSLRSFRYTDRYYYDDNYNNITINDVLDKIENEYKKYIYKNNLSNIFIYQSAVYNAIFVKDNFLYDYNNFRIEFFQIIAKTISEISDTSYGQISKDFGIIDRETLKNKIIDKFRNDGTIKKNERIKKYDDRIEEYIENDENKDIINKITKEHFDKYNTITNKQKLVEYINGLLLPLDNLNGIIIKISNIIYSNAIEKAKNIKTPKIWMQINDILNKYDEFNYILEEPDLRIGYKISFRYKDDNNLEESIPFENLSSGEKIIFELICYIFIIDNNSKNNKTKMLLLDEFDANLNPQLSKLLINAIKNELIKKNITVILTTHSPSTVAMVEPIELFSIKNENNEHKIENAKDENGKKKILEELAPNFIYEKELGFMGILAKTQKKYIIFVEGKSDKIHFEAARKYLKLEDNYEFINCGCANKLTNFLKVVKDIDFFNSLLKDKIIIGLYDFDDKGCSCISELIEKDYRCTTDNSTQYSQDVHNKINSCCNLIFDKINKENTNLSINLLMLTPESKSKFWKSKNFEIEHMYNIEHYTNDRNDGNIRIMEKIEREKISNLKSETIMEDEYNKISFSENPEYYKTIQKSDIKMKFAKYVSLHQDKFKDAFEFNFKRIFDIINSIK